MHQKEGSESRVEWWRRFQDSFALAVDSDDDRVRQAGIAMLSHVVDTKLATPEERKLGVEVLDILYSEDAQVAPDPSKGGRVW